MCNASSYAEIVHLKLTASNSQTYEASRITFRKHAGYGTNSPGLGVGPSFNSLIVNKASRLGNCS